MNKQPKSWPEAIADYLAFTKETFTAATSISSMAKLEEEGNEVCDIIAGADGELSDEYADCLMCLFDSAMREGIDESDILAAFIDKTERNKARKWKENGDGTYSHIPETSN